MNHSSFPVTANRHVTIGSGASLLPPPSTAAFSPPEFGPPMRLLIEMKLRLEQHARSLLPPPPPPSLSPPPTASVPDPLLRSLQEMKLRTEKHAREWAEYLERIHPPPPAAENQPSPPSPPLLTITQPQLSPPPPSSVPDLSLPVETLPPPSAKPDLLQAPPPSPSQMKSVSPSPSPDLIPPPLTVVLQLPSPPVVLESSLVVDLPSPPKSLPSPSKLLFVNRPSLLLLEPWLPSWEKEELRSSQP